MKKRLNLFIPEGSLRRRLAIFLYRALKPWYTDADSYSLWVDQEEQRARPDGVAFRHNPLISIVVPVFNTPEKYLRPMVYSVINQLYENWELILVNASTDGERRKAVAACAQIDMRIVVVDVKENKGISANTNAGLKQAKGEFVGFLDHDDVLADNALHEVASAINADPKIDLIYSDEDKLTDNGVKRFDPHFKPDWSPDLMTNVNYITHFVVASKKLIDSVGPLDYTKDGAQDYDFLLRMLDAGAKVYHIPKILYHWRATETSTSKDFTVKPQVTNAGAAALMEHLARNKQKGKVTVVENRPGFYRVTYDVPRETKVSVIFTKFSHTANIRVLAKHMLKTTDFDNYEVLLPEGVGINHPKAKTIDCDPSRFLNEVKQHATGNIFVFIGDGAIPKTSDWLKELAGVALLRRAGAVSPIILDNYYKIVDAGLVNSNGQLEALFTGRRKGASTFFGNTEWVRNVDALSGRVAAMTREVFDMANPSELSETCNLKPEFFQRVYRESNLYNILWPHAEFSYVGSAHIAAERGFFNPQLQYLPEHISLKPIGFNAKEIAGEPEL